MSELNYKGRSIELFAVSCAFIFWVFFGAGVFCYGMTSSTTAKNTTMPYMAELKSGVIVSGKNCKTKFDKKICEVLINDFRDTDRYDPLKDGFMQAVVKDYWEE